MHPIVLRGIGKVDRRGRRIIDRTVRFMESNEHSSQAADHHEISQAEPCQTSAGQGVFSPRDSTELVNPGSDGWLS